MAKAAQEKKDGQSLRSERSPGSEKAGFDRQDLLGRRIGPSEWG